MKHSNHREELWVLYDGLCPICLRQMAQFKRLCKDPDIHWFDITGQDDWLQQHHIQPIDAMQELHLVNQNKSVIKGLDAFIHLWSRTPLFKPLAWVLKQPIIYPATQRYYHWATQRRLRKQGRLPNQDS